ncbi:ferric-chelate reductase 1-like [Heptranchias perlo]|uniref:ferric-chelate reductase 1-like n=1 Tax=Heptranchias perlo TaxID=212740 RepID=UPI00355A963F
MEVPQLPLALLGLIALCWSAGSSLPNGAPLGVCGSLMPRHRGVSPQNTASPHSFYIKSTSGSVQVKIMGPTYKGVLLQARTPNGTTTVGTWTNPPENTKTISCFNIQGSAITHSNTVDKNNHSTYTWIPSSENCPMDVRFL